jgi:flagella basal body P-ring formation protein FlgA
MVVLLLGAALSVAATAAAQTSRASGTAVVPGFLQDEVQAQVATLWQVEAQRVVLEFGTAPDGWAPTRDAAVRLTGSGSGGYFVVRVAPPQGAESGVRVRAGVETPVVVAARPLPRGHEVQAEDMTVAAEVQWGPPVVTVDGVVAGWRTQRILREGEPLRTPAVQPPDAVTSGQAVQVVWQRGRVGVRVSGKAAGSAPLGGEIYVRTDSGQRLRGVVVAPGVVDVTSGGEDR